jgi:hypothetical protein
MNMQHPINRLAWKGAIGIAVLSCLAIMLITHDLMRSLRVEIDDWDQYRSYGVVRTLGVEWSQTWEEKAGSNAQADYQQLLQLLWQNHPDLGDLAVLDGSFHILAMVGHHNAHLLQNLQNKTLALNLTNEHVNYNNNVNIQSLMIADQNNRPMDYRYGVIHLQPDSEQSLYLVVGFVPLMTPIPEHSIYGLGVVIALLLGCVAWQVLRYGLQRYYHEPLAHLHKLGMQLQMGRWPVQAVAVHSPDAAASSPILLLASDALRRCQAAWQFWQWQIQVSQKGVAHTPQIACNTEVEPKHTEPDPVFVSYAGVELGLFFFAMWSGVGCWVLAQWPVWWRLLVLAVLFAVPIGCAFQSMRVRVLLSELGGVLIGSVLGFLILREQLLHVANASHAMTLFWLVVSGVWCLGLCRAIWIRRKFF